LIAEPGRFRAPGCELEHVGMTDQHRPVHRRETSALANHSLGRDTRPHLSEHLSRKADLDIAAEAGAGSHG
jgi:hypothetical protein